MQQYKRLSSTSAQPLLMNYKGGAYHFTLEVDGPVAFSFGPSTPLSAVVSSIKEESLGQVATASFINAAGMPLPDTSSLGDVLKSKNGCTIQLGHTQVQHLGKLSFQLSATVSNLALAHISFCA
jgi:hypothetical protein